MVRIKTGITLSIRSKFKRRAMGFWRAPVERPTASSPALAQARSAGDFLSMAATCSPVRVSGLCFLPPGGKEIIVLGIEKKLLRSLIDEILGLKTQYVWLQFARLAARCNGRAHSTWRRVGQTGAKRTVENAI